MESDFLSSRVRFPGNRPMCFSRGCNGVGSPEQAGYKSSNSQTLVAAIKGSSPTLRETRETDISVVLFV